MQIELIFTFHFLKVSFWNFKKWAISLVETSHQRL